MRLLLLLAVLLSGGCQTAEFAVEHQLSGLHVAAKFEAKDRASAANEWNGGDGSTGVIRR